MKPAYSIIIIAFFVLKPNISNNFYQKGLAYADSARYNMAVKYYSKSLKFNKKNVNALLARANSYYQLEQELNALTDFNKLLESDDQNYEVYFGRALIFIRQNEW